MQTTCLYILKIIYYLTSKNIKTLIQIANMNKLISLIGLITNALKYKVYLIILIKLV